MRERGELEDDGGARRGGSDTGRRDSRPPRGDRPNVGAEPPPPEKRSAGGPRIGFDLVRIGSGPVESALATAGDTAQDAPRSLEQLVGRDAPRRTRQGRLTPSEGHADKP